MLIMKTLSKVRKIQERRKLGKKQKRGQKDEASINFYTTWKFYWAYF